MSDKKTEMPKWLENTAKFLDTCDNYGPRLIGAFMQVAVAPLILLDIFSAQNPIMPAVAAVCIYTFGAAIKSFSKVAPYRENMTVFQAVKKSMHPFKL